MDLHCAVYGEGSTFPVTVARDAAVSTLQETIASIVSIGQHVVPPRLVALYLARRKDGTWLKADDTIDDFLKRDRQGDDEFVKILPAWMLYNAAYFGPAFEPEIDEIHILVELPAQKQRKQQQRELWVVDGVMKNALSTRVTRSELYRLASSCIGTYGGENTAFWYDDNKTLRVHVLSTEGYDYTGDVLATHYVAEEIDLLHEAIASCSDRTLLVDLDTDEFRYQSIESWDCFGKHGKAEGCQLLPNAHCRYCESCREYIGDSNNRIPLSLELRGFYDALSVEIPMLIITPESVSPAPVVDNRYAVHLLVRAVNEEYGRLIAKGLNKGSQVSDDLLTMRTVVYVENPTIFCKCLAWRSKQIIKRWREFFTRWTYRGPRTKSFAYR